MNVPAVVPLGEIERMAGAISKSGLFGMRTPEQAVALMLLAQAEGQHPVTAARDYHSVQGKPVMKAAAMLARFQDRGGRVEWHELTDEIARATFTHPLGGSITMQWDKERAERAGLLGRQTWKQYPRAMLRARLVNEAISSVFPGVCVGIYTPEEVADFDAKPPVDIPVTVITESENEKSPEKNSPISGDDSVQAFIQEGPEEVQQDQHVRDYWRNSLDEEWITRDWSSQRRSGQVRRLTRGKMSWSDLMNDPCPYEQSWVRTLYDKAMVEFGENSSEVLEEALF